MENIKQNPKSTTAKILEVLGTMASRPSGLIGLMILIFHVSLALVSPYSVSYTHLTLPTKA